MSDIEVFGADIPDPPNNWSVTIHIQCVEGTVQQSLTSHRIDGLNNAICDKAAEEYLELVKGKVKEWQEFKASGGVPSPKKG